MYKQRIMEFITLGLVLLFVIIRIIETYNFIKRVNRICGQYDWKYVETHGDLVLEMLKKDYYTDGNEWSAYYFLFLKGPNPLTLFFSLKPIRLESQYNKEALDKLKEYEII